MGIIGRIAGGSNSCSWETNGECDFAGGMQHEQQFQRYHRVLNRTCVVKSSSEPIAVAAACEYLPQAGVLVMGIDDTIERRRKRIWLRVSIPVRSSDSHLVKASGLRWLSLMLLVPIPWAQRVWALPFLPS